MLLQLYLFYVGTVRGADVDNCIIPNHRCVTAMRTFSITCPCGVLRGDIGKTGTVNVLNEK